MSNEPHLDPIQDLPPDLAELDQELSSISLDERPSFGPELRNQLGREWARPRPRRRPVWARHALAASVTLLAFAGLAVPPARASLVEGVQRIFESFRGDEVPAQDLSISSVPIREPRTAPPEDAVVVATSSDGDVAATGAPGLDLPPFQPGASALPSLLDEESDRELVRRYYPEDLQRAGIGGTVSLRLWVDEDGSVDMIQVAEGAEVQELNTAAMMAARELRFRPAMRAGLPVGTFVEFDLVFEPVPSLLTPAEPGVLETPVIPAVEGWQPPRDWTEAAVVPAPILMESREMLRRAMGRSARELEDDFGPLEGILSGDPPRGVDPVVWRRQVTGSLEEARARDPENPAPYLALARIRRKQGLRNDAQMLFKAGLERAVSADRPVSPRLVAELAYESGRVVRENWLGWRDLGEVPATALVPGRCPGAVGSTGGVASAEALLTWNYACPAQLHDVMGASFEPRSEGDRLRAEMLKSFMDAVESYPAHVGANTEILLDLADREAWHELREGARRFAWASQGHPNALLLEGLALQRLGRVEDAQEVFDAALEGLSPGDAGGFRSLELLLEDTPSEDAEAIWRTLDPILSTSVNERRMEHWARSAYALLRFGSLEADAARVWMRYGRPQAIRAFGAGPGLRLEFWDYGQGPDLSFYRPAASQNGALTTEGEEYLDDLEGVLPHWYGTRARPLYALPAQVTHFRGSREATTEVKVHFVVPAEFRSPEATGELQVGAFLLNASGTPMETVRWSWDRNDPDVDLLVPAGPGVRHVVVELYDPASGMAAGLRAPVALQDEALSELLLVDPVVVDRSELHRMGQGLHPRPLGDRLSGEQAAVFFEIYGLGTTETYRVRAELVSEGSGTVVPLEVRPAGQTLFGEEWARRPLGTGTATELLTLDLRGVGPGDFDLRILLEREDGEVVVREIRGIQRTVREADPPALELPLEMGVD